MVGWSLENSTYLTPEELKIVKLKIRNLNLLFGAGLAITAVGLGAFALENKIKPVHYAFTGSIILALYGFRTYYPHPHLIRMNQKAKNRKEAGLQIFNNQI